MSGKITSKARNLRKNQTEAEVWLWQLLRREKLGVKFRRQQPLRLRIDGKVILFIADFYCRSAKLVIEVDGGVHDRRKERDEARTHMIRSLGYEVIRFSNHAVLFETDFVIAEIRRVVALRISTLEAPLSPDLGKGAGG